MCEESLFEARINAWQNSAIDSIKIEIPKYDRVKCHTEDIPMGHRYLASKGISAKDRSNFCRTCERKLKQILPLESQLAKNLADYYETQLFEKSPNSNKYQAHHQKIISQENRLLKIYSTLPKIY